MKRILIVVYEVWPIPGGYSIRGEYIFNELAKHFELFVVVANFRGATSYKETIFERNNITFYIQTPVKFLAMERIYEIPYSGFFLRLFKRLYFKKYIHEITCQVQPDLIIGHTPADVASCAVAVAQKHRLPFLFDIRGLEFLSARNIFRITFQKWLYASIIKYSKGFVVISRATATVLKTFRQAKQKPICLITNGVDVQNVPIVSLQEILAKKKALDLKGLTIGYIGTISGYEGLDLLLEVFLESRLKDVSLLIVGEGPYFNTLKQKADQKPDVIFTGRVDFARIHEYYACIDLIVIPRKSTLVTEIITPIKLFEAMLHQKPILASNVGGLTEIITHKHNGYLFTKDNKDSLKENILYILQNYSEAQSIARLAFLDVTKHYLWSTIGCRYRDFIEIVTS